MNLTEKDWIQSHQCILIRIIFQWKCCHRHQRNGNKVLHLINHSRVLVTLKPVDKFTYIGSMVSSTKTDINTWLAKAWIASDRLSVIWKSDLTDKIKRSFFQAAVMLLLLWMATTQEYCMQYWTSPGGSIPQSSSCTATYQPSWKLSKLTNQTCRTLLEK